MEFPVIHRYVKAKNKYMKNYDINKQSSYLKYWDICMDGHNLYGRAMSWMGNGWKVTFRLF